MRKLTIWTKTDQAALSAAIEALGGAPMLAATIDEDRTTLWRYWRRQRTPEGANALFLRRKLALIGGSRELKIGHFCAWCGVQLDVGVDECKEHPYAPIDSIYC